MQVLGNLQITATALPDQGGFDDLQGVSGNTLIANNNAMTNFNFYSLKYIGSGITLFQNPSLTSFEAPRLLAIASNAGNDITTGLQVCSLLIRLPCWKKNRSPSHCCRNSKACKPACPPHFLLLSPRRIPQGIRRCLSQWQWF